jgi:hypothetical protein
MADIVTFGLKTPSLAQHVQPTTDTGLLSPNISIVSETMLISRLGTAMLLLPKHARVKPSFILTNIFLTYSFIFIIHSNPIL